MAHDLRPPFDEFVVSRWSRLVRTAVLMGSDVASAEDHVQTALLRCYKSWHRVARADDIDAYVHRAVINAAHDSRRRRWTGELPTYPMPEPLLPHPVEDGTRDVVRAALSRLPLDVRSVLVLRYYADLTERQTAQTLAIPVGTVKSRTSRALSMLEGDPELTDLASKGDNHE